MGMFAVAAGILLLVNIFVMLSDERRSQLGMLRAIGMRRGRRSSRLRDRRMALRGGLRRRSAHSSVSSSDRVIAWRADQILHAETTSSH